MSYETKELSGSMFKNKRKEKDTHPDLTGEAKIGGKLYWVSGWNKTDKNGNPWVSFALKEKDFSQAKPSEKQSEPPSDVSDDLPW